MKFNYLFFLLLFLSACGTKESDPEPDTIPDEQEIVYEDTSGLTGQLHVIAKYYTYDNQLEDAPSGTSVSLYASYEDLQNGLSLYNVFTTNDTAYFGYINYGNYYVSSSTYIDTLFYYGNAALQVRPGRKEELTITMY